MQRQLVLDVAEAIWRGAAALLDVDRMQPALDVVMPEFEEFVQLRIVGGEVEFLPDEGLEQRGMVRQAVDDLGGGWAGPGDLPPGKGPLGAAAIGANPPGTHACPANLPPPRKQPTEKQ